MGSRGVWLVTIALWGALGLGGGDVRRARAEDGEHAGEHADVAERAKWAIRALQSGRDIERTIAVEELTRLGPAAMAVVMTGLPAPESPAWEGLVEATRRIGREAVLRELSATRSAWHPSEAQGKERVLALRQERLLDAIRGLPTDDRPVVVPLVSTHLDEPSRIPPPVWSVLGDHVPPALVWCDVAVTCTAGGGLRLRRLGAHSPVKTLSRGGWSIMTFSSGAFDRRVAVMDVGGRWCVAPVGAWTGRFGNEAILVLDVDADTVPGSAGDWISVGDGAMQRIADASRVWLADRAWSIAFGRVRDDVAASLLPDPAPDLIPKQERRAWELVNRWRRSVGLAPQDLDRARVAGCRAHVAYWEATGEFSGHAELPGSPGYTQVGADAGSSSSTYPHGSLEIHVADIARSVLHRVALLAEAHEGLGVAEGALGSAIWGGSIWRLGSDDILLIPAPGARRVPTQIRAEYPAPSRDAEFYKVPRGLPVAVYVRDPWRKISDTELELRTASGELLTGDVFDRRAAYVERVPLGGFEYGVQVGAGWNGGAAAIFVADHPLPADEWLVARFRATVDGRPLERVWWFCTGSSAFPAHLEK